MYLISEDTLRVNEFKRRGTVRNISPTDFVLEDFDYTIQGWIVYVMRVNGEYMKGGIGKGMQRCRDEFNCLRPWKKCCPAGPPYGGDPWHLHALPAVRTKGVVVELFAKPYKTEPEQTDDERELNDFYRGLWTKEGKDTWKQPKRHRTTVSTLRLGERQAALAYDPPWTGPVSPEKTRVTESVCLSATSIGTISGLAADPDWVEPVQGVPLATLHFVKLYAGEQTCYTPSGVLGSPALKANFPQGSLPRNPAHVTQSNPMGFPPVVRLFTSPLPGGTYMPYKCVASNGGRHSYTTPAGQFHVDTGLLPIVASGIYCDVVLQAHYGHR